MKKITKILLYTLATLVIPVAVLATPSSVDRITNHIQPLIQTDYIQAPYFIASSTIATSMFAGNVGIGTTTPSNPLEVNGNTYIAGKLTATGTTTSLCFSNNGTTCITAGGTNYWSTLGARLFNNTGTQVEVGSTTSSSTLTVFGTTTLKNRVFVGTGSNPNVDVNTNLLVQGASDARMGVAVGNKGTFMSVGDASTYGGLFAYDYFNGVPLNLALNQFGGNAGIGTTTPTSKLTVVGTTTINSFGIAPSSNGSISLGTLLTSGGSSLNPLGTGSIDFQSYHLLSTQVASGAAANTFGVSNVASGAVSLALGNNNISSNAFSTAIGSSNSALGYGDVAIGYQASTLNDTGAGGAVSIGSGSVAADNSAAIGAAANALGDFSTATTYSLSQGFFSVAMGGGNASNDDSIAIGLVSSSDTGSVDIGNSDATKLTVFAGGLVKAHGDVYVNSTTAGIILTSPNGNCWRVTVANTGLLNVPTSVTCP